MKTRTLQPELYRYEDLQQVLSVSKTTIKRMVSAGSLPAPLRLSSGIPVWRAEEIKAWVEGLAKEATDADAK